MHSITDKIDQVTLVSQEYLNEVCPAPKSVKIELTRKCNYRCSFCANPDLAVREHMDQSRYSQYIRKIYDAGVRQLGVFYFGESFLVPWLPEAIREAKQLGFTRVFLTTNGSLATPDRVYACMQAGLDSLKFSFNYADAEQFHQITHRPAKLWYDSISHFKKARKLRDQHTFNCGLFASYIKYDGVQGERMRDFLFEIQDYADEVYALPLYTQAGTIEHPEWEFVGGNPGRADNMRPPVPCFSLFTTAHVNHDGTLNGCSFGVEEGFRHGDLNVQDFMSAWNAQQIRQLRRAHLTRKLEGQPCWGCVRRVPV